MKENRIRAIVGCDRVAERKMTELPSDGVVE